MADDFDERRRTSRERPVNWIGRTLKLEVPQWPAPQSVEIVGTKGDDLTVKLLGEPPPFGELVRLRPPGIDEAAAWLTGEVVILERLREGSRSILVTVQLLEPAGDAIERLPQTTADTDHPRPPRPSLIERYLREYTAQGLPEETLPDERATPRFGKAAPVLAERPRQEPIVEEQPPQRPRQEPAAEAARSKRERLGGYIFTAETSKRRGRARRPDPERSDAGPPREQPAEPEREQPDEQVANHSPWARPTPSEQDRRPLRGDSLRGRAQQPAAQKEREQPGKVTKPETPRAELDESLRETAPSFEKLTQPERPKGLSKHLEQEHAGAEAAEAQVRAIESRASSEGRGPALTRKRSTAPAVGIDFGTTYSKIAVLDGEEVVLLEDGRSYSSSRSAIPSVVALSSDGRVLVGEPAREMLAVAPERVISSAKRVAGLKHSDPLAHGLLGSLSCQSFAGPNDTIMFRIDDQEFTVPEVISRILDYLLQLASEWAGQKVTRAVMTYPVDFDALAKRELELAAKMSGIEVLAMVPEPVAAVMGVGVNRRDDALIAVYDFGGGTFDASVVEVGNKKFRVLGSAGDRWLGGDDLDELLARHTADVYKRSKGIDLNTRQEEFQRLLFACEETKRLLSTLEKVDVIMPNAGRTAAGPQVLMVPVERKTFDGLTEYIVASSLEISKQATTAARRDPQDVDVLLLTGGTSRIPAIRSAAERFFGRDGVVGVHPEHAVVIGAAIQAALESGEEVPADFADRLRDQVRPGHDISLVDENGQVELIFEASQPPPVAEHLVCTLTEDNQTAFRLEIVEGRSPRAKDNRSLGRFVVDGLPPRTAGQTDLNLYFVLTTTGTLHVTAQDRGSGQRARASFGLFEK